MTLKKLHAVALTGSFVVCVAWIANAQSIGGREHDTNVLGVTIGMDVPTALKTVFVNADRKPGQEKPDAKRNEGKDGKDIRVLYKSLPEGELQIVFAEGKFVKEIVLIYRDVKRVTDLRLPNSSDIGEAQSGERFDDRYIIGFLNSKKQEKLWWRDEKTDKGYQVRLTFMSGNALKDPTGWWQTIVQKAITVKPGDEEKFTRAMTDQSSK